MTSSQNRLLKRTDLGPSVSQIPKESQASPFHSSRAFVKPKLPKELEHSTCGTPSPWQTSYCFTISTRHPSQGTHMPFPLAVTTTQRHPGPELWDLHHIFLCPQGLRKNPCSFSSRVCPTLGSLVLTIPHQNCPHRPVCHDPAHPSPGFLSPRTIPRTRLPSFF